MEKFNAVIIGSGQGGNPLSAFLASKGWKTALIEKKFIGGSCINFGCTPSKTMAASAKAAYLAERSSDFGINTSSVKTIMSKVYERKKNIVESFRQRSSNKLKSDNISLFKGTASFTGSNKLKIKTEKDEFEITSEKIFIDTGGRPAIPRIKGLNSVKYLDSTSIMELTELPEHLIILGGGYISLEFAQMFKRFGSEVTIIQRSGQLLSKEDEDIADEIKKIFEEENISVILNSELKEIKNSNGRITAVINSDKTEKELNGSHILIAAGHRPNTEELNLDSAGIETDEKNYIKVNEKLETNVKGIYALGDVKGGPAFTHISFDDFRIIKDNLFGEKNRTINDRILTYTIFTDPQLGRAGLNEKQATETGINFKTAKMPMKNVARALEAGESEGLMKILINPETEKILGCSILGMEGGEMMSMIQIAMLGNLKYTSLQKAVFAHPTLAESFNNVFSNII